MVRKIEGKLFKISTYASDMLIEIDTWKISEESVKILNELKLDVVGWKLELFIHLAKLTNEGYIISSVTEFNSNGSKPKIAYTRDKDFKKILKYLQSK